MSIRKRITERLVANGHAADEAEATSMVDAYAVLTDEQRERLASLAERLKSGEEIGPDTEL